MNGEDPSSLVTAHQDNDTVHLRLNRSHKRNALTIEMMDALVSAASTAANNGCAAMVISGDVTAFSAGADVSNALPDGPAGVREQLDVHSEMEQLFRRLEQLPVVKIAKIEGPAIGAGLVLASLCEIRIMTPQAFISLTELDFGIPFSMGGLPRLVRLVGLTAAADMLLTGRRLHGDEAYRIGFASRLVAAERIDEVVTEYLTTMASRSPFLVANAVRRIRETAEDLAPSWRSDIDSLVLATYDPLSRQQSARYAKSITSPHRAP